MREMHKWKDKLEFSLDNRQIFFLFFGLSVVGCFVFALGVMVGQRVDWDPEGQVAALTDESLDLLEEEEGDQALTFKDGLSEPATAGLPATRDPSEVRKPKDEAAEASKPAKKPAAAKPKAKSPTTVLAKGTKHAQSKAKAGPRVFTLQMKAFSQANEAEKFAERLRGNGHDVRVEAHEVRGRIWHRVRLGHFKKWDVALAAKTEFEKAEHLIAYVVRE